MGAGEAGSSATSSARETRDATANRIEAALAVAVVALVLVASHAVEPAAAGHGTHERLVPIPCGFRWLTGLPCPMCGMTTSFALMARAQVAEAAAAHVLGPALYAVAWLTGLRALYALALGVRVAPAWLRRPIVPKIALGLLVAGWLVNIGLTLAG